MATLTINDITNDNIITSLEYENDIIITGTVIDIPQDDIITIYIDNKSDTTTVDSNGAFSYTLNNFYSVSEDELYVKQLIDKKTYVVKVEHDDLVGTVTTSYIAIFINIGSFVMNKDQFLTILPQDGDPITSSFVNYGPIQNRTDIILLNDNLGDISLIIDQKADSYTHNEDNDLVSPNSNVVNAISQNRVDIGNKNLLNTNIKNNLVNAINELKDKLYKPENALGLVAEYDHKANGNYMLNGGAISHIGNLNESEIPPKNILMDILPYETKRAQGSETSSSTKYNVFNMTQSSIMIRGYQVNIPENLVFYFQDTLSDDQVRHKREYVSFMNVEDGGTLPSGDNVIKVPFLGSYLNGLYSITEFRTQRTYVGDYVFTANEVSNMVSDLRSVVQSGDGIDFSSVKLIPNSTILGITFQTSKTCNATVTSDGQGITFVQTSPEDGIPSGVESCSIPDGQLVYTGILVDTELSVITISSTKDSFIVPGGIIENLNDTTVSFYRITPRYDRIYMTVDNTTYESNYWDPSVLYETNNIVKFEGYSYKAIATTSNLNKDPSIQGTFWEKLGPVYENITTKPTFVYKEGENTENGTPVIPTLNSSGAIPLCSILYIYGQEPILKNEFVHAYKMTDIKKLEETIWDNTYNIARIGLAQDLGASDQNLTRNLFIDPFFDNDFRDSELELLHNDGQGGTPTSMRIKGGIASSDINFTSITNTSNNGIEQKIQFDQTEDTTNFLIKQDKYTRSVLINKYQVVTPPPVVLTVFPQEYSWYTDKHNEPVIERIGTLTNRTNWLGSATGRITGDSSTSETVDFESVSDITASGTWWFQGSGGWQRLLTDVVETADQRTDIVESIIEEPQEVPQYNITISAPAYSFNGSEYLRVKLGELPPFYDTTTHLKAEQDGSLNHSFNIGGAGADAFKSGVRELRVEGIGTSLDGDVNISGARGRATVSQTPWLRTHTVYDIIHKEVIVHRQFLVNEDPLAQTFVLDKSAYVDSVYVMIDAVVGRDFDTIDASEHPDAVNQKIITVMPENIDIIIHETTVGLPDSERIIAGGILPKGTAVNQGIPGDYENNPPQYNKIEIFPKIKLEEGKTYAFSIGAPFETHAKLVTSDDANWVAGMGEDGIRLKLRSARLGGYSPNPGLKNIINNKQTYIDGVMLSSSNRNTWTVHQEEDLTFRISECRFNPGPKIINFDDDTTPLTNITDIVLQMGIETPGETLIDYRIKYGTTLENDINILNGEHKILNTKINNISRHQVEAILKTKESPDENGLVGETPSLYNTNTIFFGTISPLSVYVTKNIDLTNGRPFVGNKDLFVYLDVEGNFDVSRFKVYYTTQKVISSSDWFEMNLDATYEGPAIEKKFVLPAAIDHLDNYLRIKIVIETDINNPVEYSNRMGVHNLRVFSK